METTKLLYASMCTTVYSVCQAGKRIKAMGEKKIRSNVNFSAFNLTATHNHLYLLNQKNKSLLMNTVASNLYHSYYTIYYLTYSLPTVRTFIFQHGFEIQQFCIICKASTKQKKLNQSLQQEYNNRF